MTEADLVEILISDPWRKSVIDAVAELDLPDSWIAGGFVRNTAWDHLFGVPNNNVFTDVDVIYFKPLSEYGVPESDLIRAIAANEPNPVWEEESFHTENLKKKFPGVEFELKNQSRMYLSPMRDYMHEEPYRSIEDAIRGWVETATATGIRKNTDGSYSILAPHGLTDLKEGIVRATCTAQEQYARKRSQAKGWFKRWPKLRFEEL